MSSGPDSFQCSVLQVGLGDREVGAGQGGGGGRAVVKILSGCLNAIEHIRRLQDLNMREESTAKGTVAHKGQLEGLFSFSGFEKIKNHDV